MRKAWLSILLIILFNVGFSQNEANIWYFGQNAGLDFNSGVPVPLLDGELNTDEGCASISDGNGDLLFYTDGITVWNRNHTVMLNGTGLNGDVSSTHSAIVIPKPNDPNIYYIFTVDEVAEPNGLQYSEVDMTLDGGLGGITENKNILLFTPTTEKITAIKSSTANEYWVVSHKWNSNEFIAYNISDTGVNITPVISAVGTFVYSTNLDAGLGQIKISPDGTKIAVARSQGLSEVQLFDFDASTGMVSNPLTLIDINPNTEQVYGIEFSPNSKVLYVGIIGNGVFQYNLQAGSSTDIINSQLELTSLPRPYGALQLATDGKIYVAKNNQFYIDVIDNPNVVGLGCNYQFEYLYLDGRRSKFGLPPFIQTFLLIDDIQFENVCFGDTTSFSLTDTVDSATWNFDDAASGINNTSTNLTPTHIFSAPGTYEVSVNVTIGTQSASSTTTVTIYEQPTATQPQDIFICDDNNDGFYNFDLTQNESSILNGQSTSVFDITYYASITDYTNDNHITNPSSYTNTTAYNSQTIVASVKNSNNGDCEATTTFNIQVFESPTPSTNISGLSFCDDTSVGSDTDGIIEFDLTQNESIILNGQSAIDFTVNYFTDSALTNQINNPSTYQNTNLTETIYVQVVNNNYSNCVAQTSFSIEVFELPIVSSIVELKQCDDNLDGFSFFNLTEANAEISTNHLNETITFHEIQTDAENTINPITNDTDYMNQTVSTDVVWARVENNNGCYRIAQVDLIVSTTQIPNTYTRDFYQCDDGVDITDGIATFDFSSVNNEIQAMFPSGQQLIINYYRNQADALSEINPIADITNYQNIGYPNQQDVFIRVDSALDNDCLGLGHHITLHVETVPIASPVNIPEQCDDDGDEMYAFDTSTIEATLLNGQTNVTVVYFDALGNPLSSPLPNPFLTTSQTITARIINTTSQDPDGVCYDETQITFTVGSAAIANAVSDFVECDDDNDGQFAFDTSNLETTVLNGQTGMIVTYTDESGNSLPSPLPNPFLTDTQTITVRVENQLNAACYDESTIDFVVIEQPVLLMEDSWPICEGGTVEISADAGYDEYLWSTGETSQTIVVEAEGTYEVTATNTYGNLICSTSKTVSVTNSNVATITNIETIDWTQNNNSIIVFVDGNGDYEYSLDGIIYQDSNEFTNLIIDEYTIYVRDKNGCGITTESVYLLYYPKFFTPNNDSYNDTWQIKNVNHEPNSKVYIFDRYGKLLKQISPTNSGWDGTFNGEQMPTDDYWFVFERQNGNTYSGHFALKR